MRSLRTALIGLALVGVAAGLVTLGIIAGSDQPKAPDGATLVIGAVIGWAFIGTGLYAWSRRPENRIGALMTAVGFIWFLAALSASDTPWIFIVGILFGALTYALLLHMLVAFPSGRLEGKWERFFVGLAYLDTTLIPWIGVLFHETADHDTYCDGCPANPIVISDQVEFAAGAARRDSDPCTARDFPSRRRFGSSRRGSRGGGRPRQPRRLRRHPLRLPRRPAAVAPLACIGGERAGRATG
jgi:hypothetical protein